MKRDSSSSKKPKAPLKGDVVGKGKPSSVKKPKSQLEGPVGKKMKPSVKRKRMGSEIEDIFAAAAKKKAESEEENVKPSKVSSGNGKSSTGRNIVVRGSRAKVAKPDFFGDSGPSQRKKTTDGLPIYKEEELGVGRSQAGGTRLCPFDCDCCF